LPRLGILGGTFDPPHYGHIAVARAALKECRLSKIIFIPAKYPPHKASEEISSESDRLNMLRLAVENNPEFEVSDIELKRDGLSYTIDTLREIKKLFSGYEIVFIIGADNIAEMESWFKPEEILETADVIAFNRPGFVPGGRFKSRIKMFNMPPVDISSTDIRKRIRGGGDPAGLLPDAVLEYIEKSSLYKI
jgi:nicotinate-nucleotide adenylyltransferase